MVIDNDSVSVLDDVHVAAIEDEGLCLVDEDGHYWHLYSDTRVRHEDDALSQAYLDATSRLGHD